MLNIDTMIVLPLYSSCITWTNLPIPDHDGVLLSSQVSKLYRLDEIKKILISMDIRTGFEEIISGVEMKLIDVLNNDSLWIIKWTDNNKKLMALSFGSEL